MDETPATVGVDTEQLQPLCSLGDPTRRRLYEYVAARHGHVTREEASDALGIERSTAAYHLDKLVEEGLLDASFARPEGRGGPGAGRPAKNYARSVREFGVSVPPRDYRLAGELLARAAAEDATGTVRRALDQAAADLGRGMVAGKADGGLRPLLDRLAEQGYEPYADGGTVRLRNCPFHRLAREHTALICGMNLAMLAAAAEAAAAGLRARLDPGEGRCCVAFVSTASP